MNLGLEGKLAVVTAATGGLGFATAQVLAAEGARVVICGRDDARALEAAARIGQETGGEVIGLVADVSRADDLEKLFNQIETQLGGLDILVSNAGGPPSGGFLSLDENAWDLAYALTLQSVVRSVRHALPLMRSRGGGRILTIVSSSVKRSLPNLLLSNVFRPAVQGLCKSLSIELAGDNIQVNCLAPGRIGTERTDELDRARAQKQGTTFEEVRAQSVAQIPMGRFGTPEEFGRAAAFLCSPAALYISGSTVLVDGGSVNCL
ncbi:MAG: SDR family oxidoreductase [Deinococcota bacterium]|nr:SDR family oxidoreductase [Deinococcota bacterium]